jgi:hypothetical protein
VTALPLGDAEPIIPPIQIVEGQGGDLAAAESVGDEEQQDRVVTSTDDGTAIDLGQCQRSSETA